jgi:ATP-dependent DNA ligase
MAKRSPVIANGLAVFEHLRRKPTGRHVMLYAFDLLELDGEDLRRAAFEARKATLEEVPESPDAVNSGRVGRVAVTVTNESPRRGNVEGKLKGPQAKGRAL